MHTRSRRHQPVGMGPNEERTDALCRGEGKRNIAIPCTFWSALQIIHNMVSSNIGRCMWGQTHQVTHLTHVCVYEVGPLQSNFRLMHVSFGKSTRQYPWREGSRFIWAVWHRRRYEVRINGNPSQNTSCHMWNAPRSMHPAKCDMNGAQSVMQHASRNRHYTKSITPRAPRSMDHTQP